MNKKEMINGILNEIRYDDIWKEIVSYIRKMKNPSDEELLAVMTGFCIAEEPQSRGNELWRYHGGHRQGCKVRRVCRFCGKWVSWDSRWPKTKIATETENLDIKRHIEDMRACLP